MKVTNSIEEVALMLSKNEHVSYVIDETNSYELFLFSYYQYKFKTLKSFKTIVYKREKDLLYYALRFFSMISFGRYKLYYQEKESLC